MEQIHAKGRALSPKAPLRIPMMIMKTNALNSQPQCTCQAAPKLIFPCSGASDVGALADRVARQMTRDLIGKMYCLAGIGGRVDAILETTRAAARILVIDGCAQECARKTLEQAGFTDFLHLQFAKLGYVKGSSPATADNIRRAVLKGAELLGSPETKI